MGNLDKKVEKIIRKNSINTEKLKAVLLTRKLSYDLILVIWAGIIGIGGIIVYFLSLSDKNSEQTPIPEVALLIFILCTTKDRQSSLDEYGRSVWPPQTKE